MKERIDDVDREILRILQSDGRITNADLARRINMSAPSAHQRIRKLEEIGLITGYAAQLSRDRLGLGLLVMVMVSLALHQDQPIETFVAEASAMPEVLECLHVSGEYDFMLKVVAPDMEAYQKFVTHKLTAITGVAKITSSFVLSARKMTMELPLT